MAAITRLGLYGGPRKAYPGFAAAPATAAVTGTATSAITEADIRSGGKTIIITLTNDTWVDAGATFNAIRQDIIDGLDSAQSETLGWNNEVRDKEVVGAVVRTSNTVVTVTLTASPLYDITVNETITVTVPATAVTSGSPITAAPTFSVAFTVDRTGVRRHHRFLRRAPKLPWEEEEQEVANEQIVVSKPKRRRVKLPQVVAEAAADAIPVETIKVIDAPQIKIPSIGSAKLRINDGPDAEEESVIMALLH